MFTVKNLIKLVKININRWMSDVVEIEVKKICDSSDYLDKEVKYILTKLITNINKEIETMTTTFDGARDVLSLVKAYALAFKN